MNIYGEKVILRAIEKDDNYLLYHLINDPETEHMLTGSSAPVSFDGQMKWYESQHSAKGIRRYIIADREINKAIGTIILSDIDFQSGTGRVHIKLAKESRGSGVGTDALTALIKYSFDELRMNCLYTEILVYNLPSIKLFEKCGFKRDGELRERAYKDGAFINEYSYSILKSDLKE